MCSWPILRPQAHVHLIAQRCFSLRPYSQTRPRSSVQHWLSKHSHVNMKCWLQGPIFLLHQQFHVQRQTGSGVRHFGVRVRYHQHLLPIGLLNILPKCRHMQSLHPLYPHQQRRSLSCQQVGFLYRLAILRRALRKTYVAMHVLGVRF